MSVKLPLKSSEIATQPQAGPKVGLLLFLVAFVYYMVIFSGHQYSPDGVITFQAAKSLFFHQSARILPPVIWETPQTVSFFGVGMSLAYFPSFLLALPFYLTNPQHTYTPYDPAFPINPALLQNLPYFLSAWTNPAITALTVVYFYLTGLELGLACRMAAAGALVYGLASPGAVYARYDYGMPLVGLSCLAALYYALRSRQQQPRRNLAFSGLGAGLAVLTRSEYLALFVPWLGLALLVWHRRPGLKSLAWRLWPFGLSLGLGLAAFLFFNYFRFGSITNTGYSPAFFATLFEVSPAGLWRGLSGFLFSPARSIFICLPLALLWPAGLVRLWRAGQPVVAAVVGLTCLAALVYYSFFFYWWGGWGWGPRYLISVMPLLALGGWLGAAGWLATGGWRGRAVMVLVALGFAVSLNGILFDFNNWHYRLDSVLKIPDYEQQWRLDNSMILAGWDLSAYNGIDLLWLRTPPGLPALVLLLAVLAWLGWRLWAALELKTPGRPL